MFGVNWDEIRDGDVNLHTSPSTNNHSTKTSSEEFRNSQKVEHSPLSVQGFDPIQAANLRMYLQSIDGKGDPTECDHEH